MAMTAAQEAAFKAGSGNVEPNLLHLLCLGLLMGFMGNRGCLFRLDKSASEGGCDGQSRSPLSLIVSRKYLDVL